MSAQQDLRLLKEIYDQKNKKKWHWETKFWERMAKQTDWSDEGIAWVGKALTQYSGEQ